MIPTAVNRIRLDAVVDDALGRFYSAVTAANLSVPRGVIVSEVLPAPHRSPTTIPLGKMAVYAFFTYEGTCLKCGKAGPNTKARYTSQHYIPGSAPSTLAAKLLADGSFVPAGYADKIHVGQWMRANLSRANLLLPASLGPNVLSFLEAFLHICWNPKFEG